MNSIQNKLFCLTQSFNVTYDFMASKTYRNLLRVNSSAHTHTQHTFRCDCHYCIGALCAVRYVTFLRPHIQQFVTLTHAVHSTVGPALHICIIASSCRPVRDSLHRQTCFFKNSFNIPLLPHFRTFSSLKILIFFLN